MDPADSSQMKTFLEQHGVVLGRQQTQLDVISKTLEAMSTGYTDLAAQVQQLQLAQSATPPAPPLPAPVIPHPVLPVTEPRLPPPPALLWGAGYLPVLPNPM